MPAAGGTGDTADGADPAAPPPEDGTKTEEPKDDAATDEKHPGPERWQDAVSFTVTPVLDAGRDDREPTGRAMIIGKLGRVGGELEGSRALATLGPLARLGGDIAPPEDHELARPGAQPLGASPTTSTITISVAVLFEGDVEV